MSKAKKKLAALKAAKRGGVPVVNAKRENEEHAGPRRCPVLLECGHFDWDYSEELDRCGHCEKRVHAYVSNKVRGVAIALIYESKMLSELADRLGIPELLVRAERLAKLADRGEQVVGGRETFLVYPNHIKTREARDEQGKTVEAPEEADGAEANRPDASPGGADEVLALDPVGR